MKTTNSDPDFFFVLFMVVMILVPIVAAYLSTHHP